MSTELTVLTVEQRVVAAFDEKEEELRELAAGSATITAITNPDGYQQCHAARMTLKNRRIEIDKHGKEVRDEAVKFSRGVISQAAKFIALIEPEETRLEKLQKEWDDARAAEKEARIQAELKRVADLQDRVAELRGCPNLTPSSGSVLIADHIGDIEALSADESLQEFQQAGTEAKAAGLVRLRELHAAALFHEAEQARLKADREELDRLRQQEVDRQAADRKRLAKIRLDISAVRSGYVISSGSKPEDILEQRHIWAAIEIDAGRFQELVPEAEAALASALLALDEAYNAAVRRDQQNAQDAETARVAAANAAESKRLADIAAELASQQEALRKAQEPPPAPPPPPPAPMSRRGVAVPVPRATEIIDVLAKHYGAKPDTIIDWLRSMDWSKAEAA